MSVERILEKNKLEHKPVGVYFQIRCLNADHLDKNPSMFVNKYSGWAHCKSCGASYDVFQLFNEKPDELAKRKDMLREKLRKKASENTFFEIPEDAILWTGSYRGISAETITKFRAFQCSTFPGYLCFPLTNAMGSITNFIGRDTTGTRSPKYLFFYKRRTLMFPVSYAPLSSVILVEGIFDFLNLYDKGLTNARAIFGLGFTKEHVDRLKMEGITEVVLMLDPDDPGKKATKDIKEMLEASYISTKVVNLPEGVDPGDLSTNQIRSIKETLYGKSSINRDETIQNQLQ